MKSRREHVIGSVVLSLCLLTTSVLAEESAPRSEFKYTDDWAVVSAPPPPGPYRAVNIDPRVPGVDATPPLPMDAVPTSSEEENIPAEALANPPAAGIPASPPRQDSPAAALEVQQAAPHVLPGPARTAPSSPGYYYPAPPRYPAQTRSGPPAGYPAFRNQQAYRYYGVPANRQGEQTVPPPPVYDAMMRNQRSYGNPAGPGAP